MSAKSYTVSRRAYLKALFHAAKYPQCTVNGVLLTASPRDAPAVVISDAIPLLHQWTSLSPMMEVGLDLAGGYAEENGLRIVGYYEAAERAVDTSIGPVGDRVVSKLKGMNADLVAFVLDAEALSMAEVGLIPYVANPTLRAVADAFTQPPDDTPQNSKTSTFHLADSSLPAAALKAIHDQHLHRDLGDFDDHLEEVKIDWLRNPKVTAALDSM